MFLSRSLLALLVLLVAGCGARRPPNIDQRPAVRPTESFAAPLNQARVLSPFGKRGRRFHFGVDLQKSRKGGEPVLASRAGRITYAGRLSGYGNMVEIKHADGFVTRYAHLSKILVRKGRNVTAGQSLGHVGRTGRATTPHLHFEVLTPHLKYVDPAFYLSF